MELDTSSISHTKEKMNFRILLNRLGLYILGGFFVGVGVASFVFPFQFSVLGLWVGVILLLFVTVCLGVYIVHFYNKTLFTIITCICFFVCVMLGILRLQYSFSVQGEPILDVLLNESVVLEGVIIEDPDMRTNNNRLIVLMDTLIQDDQEFTLSQSSRVLVTTQVYPRYTYGERIRVSGRLREPENFTGDTGREFNYVMYLAKDDIFYHISFAEVEKISDGHGSAIKRGVLNLKRAFISRMEQIFPYPEAGLLSGLLLGEKSALGGDLEKDFRATGVIHVVVLSGYNVTLVADALIRVFGFLLGPLFGMIFGAIGIVLFAIITGAGATVVRASLMALLVLVARATGREYGIMRALFVAGFFMVIHNPKILVFDISFQLSFLATFGLIVIAPRLERYFGWVPGRFQIRENMLATLSTQIIVLPLLLYAIGDLSLVSLPANILVLVTVPWAMLFGFLATVIGFLGVSIGVIVGFPAYLLLWYEIAVVKLLAGLPFSVLVIPPFSFWVLLLLYVVVLVWMYFLAKKEKGGVFASKHLVVEPEKYRE
jgi:competence protein ComEC